MIKGITLVRSTSAAGDFDKLSSFFSALGFEPGKAWTNGSSRGAPFLAPLGNLELVDGELPGTPEILVEVTGLEAVHAVAQRWMEENYAKAEAAKRISAVQPTHWKSRLFMAEPVAGVTYGFWESDHALHGKPAAIEGDLTAIGMKFGIVVARWNAVITDRLLQGALDALLRSGAKQDDVQIVRVPGAWEIPAAARTLAETKQVDAILTLGCLLRGETAHFEAIYNEVARGIGQSQQETGVPHAFGVLTCDTLEQALDRAGLKLGNKGFEAGIAAMEMVSVQRKIVTATVTESSKGRS
ncbi:MAG TPA: 6,7-dimethyl-8-ribityllumazine synthase [Acidobacteriaceae bacterium]|jgi:6,7-dimethyl-8-ribityllumazine synthase|nr:6,7-dimethyl-8-ribityllumazine synthase [Acidobacteriaceae bacterium]